MILLMTQRYFFSLILSWLVVVSNSEVQATVCYVCNTVDNQSCSFNWTAEDVRNQLYEEFIQECPKFCTQKIVFENDSSINVWRYCEVHTFNGCNDQKDSCMFHCKDSRCNGVFSKWLPITEEEAQKHVYKGPSSSCERWKVTWIFILLILGHKSIIIFN